MIKTVIFDFDGTLADSRSFAVDLYNELAPKYGFKLIDEHEVTKLSKLSIVERLKALEVPFYRLPGLVGEMKRNYQKSVDSLKMVKGISAVMEELAVAGHRLSLISSNSKPIIERFLLNHNLPHFKHIFCSKDLFGKSHKINRYLKIYQIPKEEAIYIGDELRDIEACKKSGIRMVAVTWGYDSADLLSEGKPDFMVRDPSELAHLLQDLAIQGR